LYDVKRKLKTITYSKQSTRTSKLAIQSERLLPQRPTSHLLQQMAASTKKSRQCSAPTTPEVK